MSEMVERVARAIEPYAWGNKGFNIRREVSMDLARSAIEAMRKPTEEMYQAAWNAEVSCSYTESAHAWDAMIDAALKTQDQSDKGGMR